MKTVGTVIGFGAILWSANLGIAIAGDHLWGTAASSFVLAVALTLACFEAFDLSED